MDSEFEYIRTLERFGIRPNFWCSNEYFAKAQFNDAKTGRAIWVEDQAGMTVLPPISIQTGMFCSDVNVGDIWCGLDGFSCGQAEFLDYEYIYNPAHFKDMSGHKWATFRKNSRKYPKRATSTLNYLPVRANDHIEEVTAFSVEWGQQIKWEEVQDGNVMLSYLFEGQNRAVLIDGERKIHGINIWDVNHKFVNFRYCLCLDEPFLSEFMRLLFHLSSIHYGKLVNDGGVLGNSQLKAFKDKLNPVEVNEIFSWKRS